MDAALVIITLLSLGLTGALLVYAARLQREAEQRSEARVAALAAEIHRDDEGPAPGPITTAETLSPAARPGPPAGHHARVRVQPEEGDVPRAAATDGRASTPSNVAPRATAGDAAAGAAFSRDLFRVEADEEPSSPPRRVAAVAVGVAVIALAVVAIVGGRRGEAVEGAPTAATALAAEGAPLELVTLRHAREGSTLTISGIVRNPGDAPSRQGVAAVVFLFDRNGGFVTSARAALDYQALGAGEESPFVVSFPNAGEVGRYRVSFRTEQAIVPHVDRRAGGTSARRMQGAE
jgi:hypothetical protein